MQLNARSFHRARFEFVSFGNWGLICTLVGVWVGVVWKSSH